MRFSEVGRDSFLDKTKQLGLSLSYFAQGGFGDLYADANRGLAYKLPRADINGADK